MNFSQRGFILLIVLSVASLVAGCISPNTSSALTPADIPTVTVTQVQTVPASAPQITIPVSNDMAAKRAALTPAAPVMTTKPATQNCTPVANATIMVYLVTSAGETQIAQCITDTSGKFSFAPADQNSTTYRFRLVVTSSGILLGQNDSNTITIDENAMGNQMFSYTLFWCPSAGKAQNRGTFAVSGRSTAKDQAPPPVNNYGINDEGVK
jgi:hypothetical protein